MPFVALFLKHQLGATVTDVSVIQAVSSVAMATVALVTPRLARRFGLAATVVITELASLPFLVSNMSWPIYNQLSMEGLPSADKPLVAGWVRFGWSIAWLGGSADQCPATGG